MLHFHDKYSFVHVTSHEICNIFFFGFVCCYTMTSQHNNDILQNCRLVGSQCVQIIRINKIYWPCDMYRLWDNMINNFHHLISFLRDSPAGCVSCNGNENNDNSWCRIQITRNSPYWIPTCFRGYQYAFSENIGRISDLGDNKMITACT